MLADCAGNHGTGPVIRVGANAPRRLRVVYERFWVKPFQLESSLALINYPSSPVPCVSGQQRP